MSDTYLESELPHTFWKSRSYRVSIIISPVFDTGNGTLFIGETSLKKISLSYKHLLKSKYKASVTYTWKHPWQKGECTADKNRNNTCSYSLCNPGFDFDSSDGKCFTWLGGLVLLQNDGHFSMSSESLDNLRILMECKLNSTISIRSRSTFAFRSFDTNTLFMAWNFDYASKYYSGFDHYLKMQSKISFLKKSLDTLKALIVYLKMSSSESDLEMILGA